MQGKDVVMWKDDLEQIHRTLGIRRKSWQHLSLEPEEQQKDEIKSTYSFPDTPKLSYQGPCTLLSEIFLISSASQRNPEDMP